MTTYLIYVERR